MFCKFGSELYCPSSIYMREEVPYKSPEKKMHIPQKKDVLKDPPFSKAYVRNKKHSSLCMSTSVRNK